MGVNSGDLRSEIFTEQKMSVTRRKFIKLSMASAALAYLSSKLPGFKKKNAIDKNAKKDSLIKGAKEARFYKKI